MRRWLWVALALAGISCGGPEAPPSAPPEPSPTGYEAVLYELGAYPVRRLKDVNIRVEPGQPPKLYSKQREDVNGWISPRDAGYGLLLTPGEMKRAGIPRPPLSYERYVQILDVDEYNRTKDPLLGTAMLFVLDRMMWEETPLKDKEDVLRIYRSGIELDPEMLRDLSGWGLGVKALRVAVPQLTATEYMALYREHSDPWILLWDPRAGAETEEYARFLLALTEDGKVEMERRQQCYERLYRLDPVRYRVPIRDWMIAHLADPGEWFIRRRMYGLLLEIGDEVSLAAVNKALLTDPVTDCREGILYYVKSFCRVMETAESVLALSTQPSFEDELLPGLAPAPTPSRCPDGYHFALKGYLSWAVEAKELDEKTREILTKALHNLEEGERRRRENWERRFNR